MSCLFGFVLRETTESWTQMNESTTPIIFIGALLASIFILYVILVVRFLLKSSPKSTETSDKKPDGASPKGFPYLASPLSPLGMENLLMHRCVPVQPRSYEELVRVKPKGALGAFTGAQSLVLMEDMQLSFFPWFCSSFSIFPGLSWCSCLFFAAWILFFFCCLFSLISFYSVALVVLASQKLSYYICCYWLPCFSPSPSCSCFAWASVLQCLCLWAHRESRPDKCRKSDLKRPKSRWDRIHGSTNCVISCLWCARPHTRSYLIRGFGRVTGHFLDTLLLDVGSVSGHSCHCTRFASRARNVLRKEAWWPSRKRQPASWSSPSSSTASGLAIESRPATERFW